MDESPEFILPIDIIVHIVMALPNDVIDRVLSGRNPRLMSYKQIIREVVQNARSVESGKMAVYAVMVEESCRKMLVGLVEFEEGMMRIMRLCE